MSKGGLSLGSLGFKEGAAVSRIAVALARSVTNAIIDDLAKELGFKPLQASNKTKKIQLMLGELLADARSRPTATKAVHSLTMEAHHRTVAGNAAMSAADADSIVADMRVLQLPVGDLAQPGWRVGLKGIASANPATPVQVSTSPAVASTRPQRHEGALSYIVQLAADGSRPQHRGCELEKVLFEVLLREALQPTCNIVNPGEQIDLAFVLDGQHYLVECKWEKGASGLPHVAAFATKVARKAEGTFGVLLSMTGFVGNINDTATRGTRLNCVGMGSTELMAVLEGRRTFGDVVRRARAQASTRATFHAT
jgi:hypothetical protein